MTSISTPEQLVIGYDIRTTLAPRASGPDYLYFRLNYPKIISIDPFISPRISNDRLYIYYMGEPHENSFGLFDNFPVTPTPEPGDLLISVTADKSMYEEEIIKTGFPPNISTARSEVDLQNMGWIFFGYDVYTSGLISGISNCAPNSDYIKNLFSNSLNEHGLFSDRLAAEELCELRNDQIPAHRPFHVVSIWNKSSH